MAYKLTSRADVTIVRLEKLELVREDEYLLCKKALMEAFTGCQKVVLNLENVTQISSAAINELLALQCEALTHGVYLVLCSVCPEVYEKLVVTRATSTFQTAGSEEEALQCLSQ